MKKKHKNNRVTYFQLSDVEIPSGRSEKPPMTSRGGEDDDEDGSSEIIFFFKSFFDISFLLNSQSFVTLCLF